MPVIRGSPDPKLLSLVAHKRLQLIEIGNLRNFIRFGRICYLIPAARIQCITVV